MDWLICNSKQISELAQAVALLAAAAYFAWKLIAGYFICNLSIDAKLSRFARENAPDVLSLEITLEKGDRASVLLSELSVIAKESGPAGRVLSSEKLQSPSIPDGTRMVRMSPGEKATFGHCCEVPSGTVAYVEVLVAGSSYWLSQTGFWKASAFSFPPLSAAQPISTPGLAHEPAQGR